MAFALVNAWTQQCREPASTDNCPACAWTEDAQGTVHKNTEGRADFSWAPAGPFFLALLVFKQPGLSLLVLKVHLWPEAPGHICCGQARQLQPGPEQAASQDSLDTQLPVCSCNILPTSTASSTQSQQRGPWGGEVALKPLSQWRRTRSMHRCKCTACCSAQLDTCT